MLTSIYLVRTCTHMLHFSEINDDQLLNIVIEINITTEGDVLQIYIANYRSDAHRCYCKLYK